MALSKKKVRILLNQAQESMPHAECHTCECYMGYLTQLKLDSDEAGKELIQDYEPSSGLVHS